MTSEDTDDLPFNAEVVRCCRTVAVDAIMNFVMDHYDGTLSYPDAVYAGAAIAAQLCSTATTLEGVRAGVSAVADSVNSGGFLSTAIAYHHSIRAANGDPVSTEEYDA